MIEITDDIYQKIAIELKEKTIDKFYWTGTINTDEWEFTGTLMMGHKTFIPIWWEFNYSNSSDETNFKLDKLLEIYSKLD